jgi:hypothetical protein
MRKEGLLERLSTTSAGAQASVPGVYAWAVTVGPIAWVRGAPLVAKIAAGVALLLLVASVLPTRASSLSREPTTNVERGRRWVGLARPAFLWGFVVASAVVWAAAPNGMGPVRVDTPRGLAGMLAWALFAFASAAPVVRTRMEEPEHPVEQTSSAPRRRLPKGDLGYVAAGGVLGAMLQVPGWRIVSAERALLLRLIALAAGLAVIGAMTQVALQRHAHRATEANAWRLRRALAPLVVLGILMLSGLLMFVLD